jgi:hypothetical protein
MAAPSSQSANRNDEQILNYCTRHLARGVKLFTDNISNTSFNLSTVSENWRFPIVESAADDNGETGNINRVTLVWKADGLVNSAYAVGNFIPWYEKAALTPVMFEGNTTSFYACTLLLPIGKSYYYRFVINGNETLDPVNPQFKILSNGKTWSFFFTDYYNSSEEFEEWEVNLLYRLTSQVVPFRTKDAQNFIERFYLSMAKPDKFNMPIYRLDDSVGEVNFITNIISREERQHLTDYKICLSLIDQLLRKRNPTVDSWVVSEELITDLYNEMASGNVPDWDYIQYNNPTYFLGLIRRHALTGAFSHPRYGGNIAGAGWNYLQGRYNVKNDAAQTIDTLFDWQLAIEKPAGTNADYRG